MNFFPSEHISYFKPQCNILNGISFENYLIRLHFIKEGEKKTDQGLRKFPIFKREKIILSTLLLPQRLYGFDNNIISI